MGRARAFAAAAFRAWAQAHDRFAGSGEYSALHGAVRLRVADVAGSLPAIADSYWWFRRFVRSLLFRTIHDVALMIDRERAGREASPTAGVIDSQAVKAPMIDDKRGYDGEKIVGRKRHITVDTDGIYDRRKLLTRPPLSISWSRSCAAPTPIPASR